MIRYVVVTARPPTSFRGIGTIQFPMLYETRELALAACRRGFRVAEVDVQGDCAREVSDSATE